MSADLEALADEVQREHRSKCKHGVSRGGLSPREVEVLRMLCAGKCLKLIAREWDRSYRTLETHSWRIMQKTGCKTSAELGVWAVRNGIVML